MDRTVLLVEDNDLNQDMMSRFLELMGFRVVLAGDGLEAIRLATEILPDVILMDMSLPELDGWEATRRLKAAAQTAAIPVIALTAHAMVGDREQALRAGCDDFDTKPCDFRRLVEKIEAVLLKPEVA